MIQNIKKALEWWGEINGTFEQKELGEKYYPHAKIGLSIRQIFHIWKSEKLNNKQETYTKQQMFEFVGIWIQKEVSKTGVVSQLAFEKWFNSLEKE